MVTDVVCEYIVARKKGKAEKLKIAGIVAATLAVEGLLCYLGLSNPSTSLIMLIIMGCVVYGAVYLLKRLSVEYEYSFVNGELSIDKIINKTDRVPLLAFDVKKVEKAGKYNAASFNTNGAGHVYNFSSADEPDDAVFLRFRNDSEGMTTAIISCPDEFIEKMKPYFNQLVYREAFKK